MPQIRIRMIVAASALLGWTLAGWAVEAKPKSSNAPVDSDSARVAVADSQAAAPAPAGAEPTHPSAEDMGYDDEPPLDWPERQWRWYTRHVRPQRFAGRDRDTNYGTDSPFAPYGYYRRNYYGFPFGGSAYDPAEAYVQGRYDERQFREWKEHHDKGLAAYADAMAEGVQLFRETDYAGAVGAFARAAELNQGDPASRIHAAYALVAIGNYDDAVLMIRRAIQLQSRLMYLPLSIREEYGPQVDFDAHLKRLRETTENVKDDPGLWMLLGYYQHFSGNRAAANRSLNKAAELAPHDRLIEDFQRAVRLQTPTKGKPVR